jgi:hypothetical protein
LKGNKTKLGLVKGTNKVMVIIAGLISNEVSFNF